VVVGVYAGGVYAGGVYAVLVVVGGGKRLP
jgi:hypothetical protein